MTANELGDIREDIGGLKNAIETLTRQWAHQDREANDGRRSMYETINGLRLDVRGLQIDVAAMKPDVENGTRARLQASGARNILKVIWYGLAALLGAVGTSLFNWLGHGR